MTARLFYLPGYNHSPEFKEGFEHLHDIPRNMALIIRSLGLPYSEISNKQLTRDEIEYGSLQEVIEKFNKKFEHREDSDTGLMKGVAGGIDSGVSVAVGVSDGVGV